MLLLGLLMTVLSAEPNVTVSDVACQSVGDCWLDADSKPIARPKKLRGKPIPGGDCGARLQWLRNKLACEKSVCVVRNIGDRC